jgi:hypothetical protein
MLSKHVLGGALKTTIKHGVAGTAVNLNQCFSNIRHEFFYTPPGCSDSPKVKTKYTAAIA